MDAAIPNPRLGVGFFFDLVMFVVVLAVEK
jgi:hypothetical protein